MGRSVVVVAGVVAVVAAALSGASGRWMLVTGTTVVSRTALSGTVLLAGSALLAGYLLARRRGPRSTTERAVLRGVVVALAYPVSLVVPLVGFLVLISVGPLVESLTSPGWLGCLVGCVGLGAAALAHDDPAVASSSGRRARRSLAALALTAGVAGLGVLVFALAMDTLDDEMVVVRGPDGCTAVVRQVQDLFTGEVTLFVAAPGSSFAQRVADYRLEETFPFRDGAYLLEPRHDEVRIAFDDGLGGVDATVPCR